MAKSTTAAQSGGLIAQIVDFARRRPGAALGWVLGIHLVVWTVLPALVCANLQLDLVEDLALGKEWQLGYWKHPPLPWWVADAVYRATGSIDSIYILGPLSAVVCLYFVWRLARDVAAPEIALIAVLALEGLHFFNFSVVKFAHDQMQLPFWALTGWFVYRAIKDQRPLDWIASGAFLALCFWSKYAAFALAATIGLFLLFDPVARLSWRKPGPYLMALAFLVVLGPNLWWLVTTGFMPFRYVDARAIAAQHWYDYLVFPLRWSASQLFFLLPTIALIGVASSGLRFRSEQRADFAARYVAALALGPFVVTTVVALVLGRLPVAMWGYPLWSFAPLAALMWFTRAPDGTHLRRFAALFVAVFVAVPTIYAAIEVFEPLVRNRPKATQFPGRQLAETLTREWRAKTGVPLVYVGGVPHVGGPGEFAANNIAVYSPDRPHVIVHGELALSPWVDPADLARRGAIFVWAREPQTLPEAVARAFPQAQTQPQLTLPSQAWFGHGTIVINYAILPPQR